MIINYKIVSEDIRNNIIKNKYLIGLIFLLPFFLIFEYSFSGYDLSTLFTNILISFIIGFGLYLSKIWSAGDSKYFIVLSTFLTDTGILTFLGNLSLISIVVIIFFFFKNFLLKNESGESVITLIKKDLGKIRINIINTIKHSSLKSYTKIINVINGFFIIFLIIRLLRYLFFEKIILFTQGYSEYLIHILIASILFLIFIFFMMRKIYKKIEKFMVNNSKLQKDELDQIKNMIFFVVMLILTFSYMKKNPDIFYEKMYFFLTIGILIYIFIRIGFYLYKASFLEIEKQNINTSKLQVGDTFENLWYQGNISNDRKNNINKKIENTAELGNVQKYLYDQSPSIDSVKILKTFAFAPIICFSFLVNFFYENIFLSLLFNFIKNILFLNQY